MKKWFWILLIIILIFAVLGFLYSQGLINVKWQPLAMILAAFAAPFTFLKNFISGGTGKTSKILQQQKNRVAEENKRRVQFDAYVKAKDERINELEAEVVKLETEVDSIKLEIQENEDDINDMTEIEDLQGAFMEGYTDEK